MSQAIAQQPANRVDIWRARGLDYLELHSGSEVTVEYPRHWHQDLYVCATLEGASHLDFCGRSDTVTGPALAVVPAGEIHANRKIGCSFRCIFIDTEALRSGVEAYVERGLPAFDFRPELIDHPEMTQSFLRSHRALENSASELSQDHALFQFLHQFVSLRCGKTLGTAAGGSEDTAVQKTRRYLDEHYAEPVSLRDLARLTGLSPYHVNRSFSRGVGMPPHAYQLQLRLRHAKTFLRQGRPVAEAASLAGFYDQSHFTHHFKRSERLTPRQYQRYRKDVQDNRVHSTYFQR